MCQLSKSYKVCIDKSNKSCTEFSKVLSHIAELVDIRVTYDKILIDFDIEFHITDTENVRRKMSVQEQIAPYLNRFILLLNKNASAKLEIHCTLY